MDASGGDSKTGYLYVSRDYRWPADPLADGRLPDAWLTTDSATDQVDILDSKRKYLPDRVRVAPDGTIAEGDLGMVTWFISTPFAFCLRCGVSYEQVRGQDFGKLATLDSEGRSSALSLLSASIIRALSALPESELPLEARKLLTFVDNRQDASLQAGHLNDFVQVSQLRAALFSALKAKGDQGSRTTRSPPLSRPRWACHHATSRPARRRSSAPGRTPNGRCARSSSTSCSSTSSAAGG